MKRILVVAAALAASIVVPVPTVGAAGSEPPVIDAPRFKEVGRVPVLPNSSEYLSQMSGWLVLSPASRRGYVLTERTGATTVIQSFDLDTLQPRKRVIVPGVPIPSGFGAEGTGGATFSGDIVHAVDPGTKRLYLPMSNGSLTTTLVQGVHPDAQRLVTYFLVLDEVAFDRDPARAFGTFTFPADQQRLQAYPLVGMTVSRHHVAPDRPGKLIGVFASPNFLTRVLVVNQAIPGVFDHTLAQWDPANVPVGTALPTSSLTPGARPVQEVGDWAVVMAPCATAPLTAQEAGEVASVDHGQNLEWEVLATREAAFVGCQSAPQSGAVVRVALNPTTALPTGDMQLVSLAKPVTDLLVDDRGERLFLRSYGRGSTFWVFDATEMRFTGSVAGILGINPLAAGVEAGSGRLYQLTPDTCVPRASGGSLPVRGGLRVAEAGLDPVPAPENVIPDLAYNSWWRIHVDPVTRRVFVRRGVALEGLQDRYPRCEQGQREAAPQEFFYRVYEDRIPLAVQPAGLDDATLTTDADEAEGLTEASYLGSGSGYGSRSLLIGGLDAPTGGAATAAQSLCGREDREAVMGSVGKVEVSDQSTAAEAAALDADAATQDVLGDPLSRCRPQAPSTRVNEEINTDDVNACHGNVDVREGAFDQSEGVDRNGDGCHERDDDNRYAARCLGAKNSTSPGFDDDEHVVPRDGFEATAKCDEKKETATGSATGSLSTTSPQQADAVKVARSSSTVSVGRKLGKGVTVKVDSIARGVEITGVGTIGVVRAEAVSTATGRARGAAATFTRTICDVDVQGLVVSGCLGDEREQQTVVDHINKALGSRGTARLRSPDPTLAAGTAHGYLAALQRDRKELFADQSITRDRSLAVPALEIVVYQGEGAGGAGRQVFHLAGVQASTSYGIACSYGRKVDGSCAKAGEEAAPSGFFDSDLPSGAGDPITTTITETLPGETALPAGFGVPKENVITRLLRAVPRAVAQALQLLFNNPRELGLLAALWALLYAPCYLGDRRRAVRSVAARRLTSPLASGG